MSSFLILHGLEGSGPDHWQTWLAAGCGSAASASPTPTFPIRSILTPPIGSARWAQSWRCWTSPIVLCHSLACLLWLRASRGRAPSALASRVLLVAPPWRDDLAPVARFLDHGARARDVTRAAAETLIVCSDDDPYCPPGRGRDLRRAAWNTRARDRRAAGHINPDAGYGEWPDVERWALGDGGFPAP